jgi:hypothetical protein
MENLGEVISKYWGFVLFLLGLCFHAIWTYIRVGEHERDIRDLKDKSGENTNSINEIKSVLNSMESKLDILVEGFNTKKK